MQIADMIEEVRFLSECWEKGAATSKEVADSIDGLMHTALYSKDETVRPLHEVRTDLSDLIPRLIGELQTAGDNKHLAAACTYSFFAIPSARINGNGSESFEERDKVISHLKAIEQIDSKTVCLLQNAFSPLDYEFKDRNDYYYFITRAVANLITVDDSLAKSFIHEMKKVVEHYNEYSLKPTNPGNLPYYILLMAQHAYQHEDWISFRQIHSLYSTRLRKGDLTLEKINEQVRLWEGIVTALVRNVHTLEKHRRQIKIDDGVRTDKEHFFNFWFLSGWGGYQTYYNRYDPRIMHRLALFAGDKKGLYLDLGSSAIVPLLSDIANIGWNGRVIATDKHSWSDIFPYVLQRRITPNYIKQNAVLISLNESAHQQWIAHLGIQNVVANLEASLPFGEPISFVNSSGCITNTLKGEYRLNAMLHALETGQTGNVFNLYGYSNFPPQLVGAYSFIQTREGYSPIRLDIGRIIQSHGEHKTSAVWFYNGIPRARYHLRQSESLISVADLPRLLEDRLQPNERELRVLYSKLKT
ncbi:MAG: hypothetical protein V1859_08830 [archaeon]